MKSALNILFFLAIGAFLAHPQAVYGQNEGYIEIEARVLPATSGTVTEGSSSASGTSTSVQEGEAEQQAADQTGPETGTAQTAEGGEQGEQPPGSQEPGTAGQQPTNTMTVRSQNSVLVEVEKQNQIFLRRLLNFEGTEREGEIDVGSLEESTSVDIIHVTL